MSVNPGWGGQPFIRSSPDKLRRLAELDPQALLEVDGGIDPTTAGPVADAGATLFVAGSAIFGTPTRRRPTAEIAAAAGAQ